LAASCVQHSVLNSSASWQRQRASTGHLIRLIDAAAPPPFSAAAQHAVRSMLPSSSLSDIPTQ
jgi:hypothetical protein